MLKYLPGGPHVSTVDPSQPHGNVSPRPSVSDVVVKCVGEDVNYEGIRLLFEGLQQPLLNKQVRVMGGWGGRDSLYSSVFVSTDDLRPAGRGRAGAFS